MDEVDAAAKSQASALSSQGLNPDASPFDGTSSPGSGRGERLSFTDSEASFGSEPPSPAPEGKGKAAVPASGHRRHTRRRHLHRAGPPEGFMAAARRSHPQHGDLAMHVVRGR